MKEVLAEQGVTRLDEFDNSWYQPGRSLPVRLLWHLVSVLFFLNPLILGSGIKCWWLRLFGARIGKHVVIKTAVNIKRPWYLEVGDHCWIGERVWIYNDAKVTLGQHVCVSQDALLLTGNHNYKQRRFDLIVGEITLDDGVWIGARAVVCPGVTCRSHSVLAVSSVANHDLESYGIYQGNPAAKVRQRVFDAGPADSP